VTAYELKKAEPALRVALLEARQWATAPAGVTVVRMTVVSLGFGTTAMLRGQSTSGGTHLYGACVDRTTS